MAVIPRWRNGRLRYQVQMRSGRGHVHLGTFATEGEAREADRKRQTARALAEELIGKEAVRLLDKHKLRITRVTR